MSATIQVWGETATFDGESWQSSDAMLEATLRLVRLDPLKYYPNIEQAMAEAAAAMVGGTVIRDADPLPFDPDVIY